MKLVFIIVFCHKKLWWLPGSIFEKRADVQKKAKDHVTVNACANVNGSIKLPLLYTGKLILPFFVLSAMPKQCRSNAEAMKMFNKCSTWLQYQPLRPLPTTQVSYLHKELAAKKKFSTDKYHFTLFTITVTIMYNHIVLFAYLNIFTYLNTSEVNHERRCKDALHYLYVLIHSYYVFC